MTKKKFKIMIYIRIVLLLALIGVLILTKHMEKVKAFRESIEEIGILKDCKNVEKTKDLEKIYNKLVENGIIEEDAKFEGLPKCGKNSEYTCVFGCVHDGTSPQLPMPGSDYDIDYCKVNFIRNRSKDNNIVCGIEDNKDNTESYTVKEEVKEEVKRDIIKDKNSNKNNGNVVEYYANGQISSEGAYNGSGEKDGEWISYYENGQVMGKMFYENGKMEGKELYYYRNGQVLGKIFYKNGEVDGEQFYYYENGQIRNKRNYKDGEVDGEQFYYYENGQIEEKMDYTDGKLNGEIVYYYENGQVMEIGNIENGEGKSTFYSNVGKIIGKIEYKDERPSSFKGKNELNESCMKCVVNIRSCNRAARGMGINSIIGYAQGFMVNYEPLYCRCSGCDKCSNPELYDIDTSICDVFE